MPALAWLLLAVGFGAAAYLVGWPAWQAYRAREARDLNAERYLAWRGRASRGPAPDTREGMTGEERRRVYAGAALGILAVASVLAFLAAG